MFFFSSFDYAKLFADILSKIQEHDKDIKKDLLLVETVKRDF